MYAYCLIGMTKQGKSRFARGMVSEKGMDKFGCIVNDVNDEYGRFRKDRETGELRPSLNLPNDTNMFRSRFIPDIDSTKSSIREYLKITRRKKNCTCIYEECTAFFKGRTPPELCEIIIAKGHTNCNHVFCFHSIRSVPPELLGLMDFVVLFKTGDSEKIVKDKDEKLLPYWLSMTTKKDGAQPYIIEWQSEIFNEDAYYKLKQKIRRGKK